MSDYKSSSNLKMGRTENQNAFMETFQKALFRPGSLSPTVVLPASYLVTHALSAFVSMILGIILLNRGILYWEKYLQGIFGPGFPLNFKAVLAMAALLIVLFGIHILVLWIVSTVLEEQELAGIRFGTGLMIYFVLSIMSVLLLWWLRIALPFGVILPLVLVPLAVTVGIPLMFSVVCAFVLGKASGGGSSGETAWGASALAFTPITFLTAPFLSLVSYSVLMDRPGGGELLNFTVFICISCILVKYLAAFLTAPVLGVASVWSLAIHSRLLRGVKGKSAVIAVQTLLLAGTCLVVFLLCSGLLT